MYLIAQSVQGQVQHIYRVRQTARVQFINIIIMILVANDLRLSGVVSVSK